MVTYNVLFDLYKKDQINTPKRIVAALKYLRDTRADIIGLEEVTQRFLIQLLREKWVQQEYYLSDSTSGSTVKPYGQLLLSRIPFTQYVVPQEILFNFSLSPPTTPLPLYSIRLLQHKFSKMKTVIIGQFLVNDEALFVPVVHLTSDKMNTNTNIKRKQQLDVIFEYCCPPSNPYKLSSSLLSF